MSDFEGWALEQLKRVLSSSDSLADLSWNNEHLLDALFYAKRTSDLGLERSVRNLICSHLRDRSPTRYTPSAPSLVVTNRTLVQLYEHPELKNVDPILFGFIFCSILSAGHKSFIWGDLTLDDRTKLLVAQVYLTPLPPCHFRLSWIETPSEISSDVKEEDRATCFSKCATRFENGAIFARTFDVSYVQGLHANGPLAGINALRTLPQRRREIARSFEHTSWQCQKDCGDRILRALEKKIDSVFKELSDSYHDKIY
jgi:hypothetical protein